MSYITKVILNVLLIDAGIVVLGILIAIWRYIVERLEQKLDEKKKGEKK